MSIYKTSRHVVEMLSEVRSPYSVTISDFIGKELVRKNTMTTQKNKDSYQFFPGKIITIRNINLTTSLSSVIMKLFEYFDR